MMSAVIFRDGISPAAFFTVPRRGSAAPPPRLLSPRRPGVVHANRRPGFSVPAADSRTGMVWRSLESAQNFPPQCWQVYGSAVSLPQ